MGWGKGGLVGVRRAVWEHDKSTEQAARILADEHGVRHEPGSRKDLCPKCQAEQRLGLLPGEAVEFRKPRGGA
jgi:hypothetical protein